MNTSGEAADQVMRMMLNGAEVLIKLSGSGAKNAAVLLYSIAREQKKTKGAARGIRRFPLQVVSMSR